MEWYQKIDWLNNLIEDFYTCFIEDDRYMLIVDGIGVTVKVALLAAVLGMAIGFIIAVCNLSKSKILNFIGIYYVFQFI